MPVTTCRRLCLALMLWVATGIAPVLAQQPVVVFAAASLKTALDEVAARFSDTTGTAISISYGGSSALARQIRHGAPAQVFVSASPDWMDALQEGALLAAGTRSDLLTNRLVLIAAPGSTLDLRITPGFDLAAALGQGRLAMALVNAVPAGIYGRQALQSLGVWDAVQGRIAQTDNVRAALRLVAVGEAPLGIVYATDARADPRVRVLDSFPADSHAPILYPAAILREGDTPQARAFFGFLTGAEAGAIFVDNGFGLAGNGT